MPVITTKVTGVTNKNKDGTKRQDILKEAHSNKEWVYSVSLKREFSNAYDPHKT